MQPCADNQPGTDCLVLHEGREGLRGPLLRTLDMANIESQFLELVRTWVAAHPVKTGALSAANIHFGRKRRVQTQTAGQGSATTSEDTAQKPGTKAKAQTVIPLGRCCRQHHTWEAQRNRRHTAHAGVRQPTSLLITPRIATQKQFGATSLSKEPA